MDNGELLDNAINVCFPLFTLTLNLFSLYLRAVILSVFHNIPFPLRCPSKLLAVSMWHGLTVAHALLLLSFYSGVSLTSFILTYLLGDGVSQGEHRLLCGCIVISGVPIWFLSSPPLSWSDLWGCAHPLSLLELLTGFPSSFTFSGPWVYCL